MGIGDDAATDTVASLYRQGFGLSGEVTLVLLRSAVCHNAVKFHLAGVFVDVYCAVMKKNIVHMSVMYVVMQNYHKLSKLIL